MGDMPTLLALWPKALPAGKEWPGGAVSARRGRGKQRGQTAPRGSPLPTLDPRLLGIVLLLIEQGP